MALGVADSVTVGLVDTVDDGVLDSEVDQDADIVDVELEEKVVLNVGDGERVGDSVYVADLDPDTDGVAVELEEAVTLTVKVTVGDCELVLELDTLKVDDAESDALMSLLGGASTMTT